MNIKSRLKTIERKFYKEISAFCLCYGINLRYEIVPITIDEWKRRFDTGEERHERLPDFCNHCEKPVDKRFIETTFEEWQKTQNRNMQEMTERINSYFDN